MNISLELMLLFSIALPLFAVAAIMATGGKPNLREGVTISTSLVLLYFVTSLYQGLNQGKSISIQWLEIIPGLGLNFNVEPLGLLLALIASFLWLITTIYSIGYMRGHGETNQTRFYSFFAIAISSVMGVAFAADLFTLFIFYEVLTLSTYPLVTHASTQKAKAGGRIYLGILLGTSIVFFLLAIISTWFITGTLNFKSGGIFNHDVDTILASVILILFVFGIGKAALMPFHSWLPAAMVAPSPVSALLHAVAVVKAGVFAILKVSVYIFGIDLLSILPGTQFLLYLAGISVLMASLIAMRQDNLKLRLAYSTVSQLGYVTIGALLATSAGVIGGSMHIAMHAFGKITLFFCAGAILVATHKSKISDMQGIGWQMPITMTAFFIASLSIVGVPPAGGTWSKWFLLMATIDTGQWFLMVTLMISSLLSIAYLIPISFRAFFPQNNDLSSGVSIKEAPLNSLIALSITTLFCVILFVYPHPLYELAEAILTTSQVAHGQ